MLPSPEFCKSIQDQIGFSRPTVRCPYPLYFSTALRMHTKHCLLRTHARVHSLTWLAAPARPYCSLSILFSFLSSSRLLFFYTCFHNRRLPCCLVLGHSGNITDERWVNITFLEYNDLQAPSFFSNRPIKQTHEADCHGNVFWQQCPSSAEYCIAGNFRQRKISSRATIRQFVRNIFSSNVGRRSLARRLFARHSFAYRLFSHS